MTENKFIKKKTAEVQIDPVVLQENVGGNAVPSIKTKEQEIQEEYAAQKAEALKYQVKSRPNFWVPLIVPILIGMFLIFLAFLYFSRN